MGSGTIFQDSCPRGSSPQEWYHCQWSCPRTRGTLALVQRNLRHLRNAPNCHQDPSRDSQDPWQRSGTTRFTLVIRGPYGRRRRRRRLSSSPPRKGQSARTTNQAQGRRASWGKKTQVPTGWSPPRSSQPTQGPVAPVLPPGGEPTPRGSRSLSSGREPHGEVGRGPYLSGCAPHRRRGGPGEGTGSCLETFQRLPRI